MARAVQKEEKAHEILPPHQPCQTVGPVLQNHWAFQITLFLPSNFTKASKDPSANPLLNLHGPSPRPHHFTLAEAGDTT
ncbi:unnamed protein product [Prunus armeniaca]|uniref:Uncharacterized protein n=1 Tax=Prunus armeniaca TaxID=36596 RepID=A0A6J5XK01_PRUAR|nr:unnamed protein product [Prunus armeniaca]CAB4314069.1 unnamed protein product [Prunus armeniaca]